MGSGPLEQPAKLHSLLRRASRTAIVLCASRPFPASDPSQLRPLRIQLRRIEVKADCAQDISIPQHRATTAGYWLATESAPWQIRFMAICHAGCNPAFPQIGRIAQAVRPCFWLIGPSIRGLWATV